MVAYLDSGESCDFVAQPVQEYGQAGGQLGLQVVAQVADDLAHARDGTLLDLLVYVGSTQALQSALIEFSSERLEVKVAVLVQRPDDLHHLLQHQQSLGRDLVEAIAYGSDHWRQQSWDVLVEDGGLVRRQQAADECQRVDLHVAARVFIPELQKNCVNSTLNY
jgi:hypothetical protein